MPHQSLFNSELFEVINYLFHIYIFPIPHILWSFVSFFIPKRSKNVDGQLALITGGSEGIGRAIAFELARKGCRIALVNRNIKKGEETAKEIREKFKIEIKAFACDVSKASEVKRLKMEVKKSMGTVDMLINNAGLMPMDNSLLEGDDEYYQYVMDVNLTSYLWTTRAFLPDMIKRKRGHIVGVSSITARCSIPSAVTYIATKYGNKGFLDALREEMCFFGYDEFIKISTVMPGYVLTNDSLTDFFKKYILVPVLVAQHPDEAARNIVDGILKNQEDIYSNWHNKYAFPYINALPRFWKTKAVKKGFRAATLDEFTEMRLKKCTLLQE